MNCKMYLAERDRCLIKLDFSEETTVKRIKKSSKEITLKLMSLYVYFNHYESPGKTEDNFSAKFEQELW